MRPHPPTSGHLLQPTGFTSHRIATTSPESTRTNTARTTTRSPSLPWTGTWGVGPGPLRVATPSSPRSHDLLRDTTSLTAAIHQWLSTLVATQSPHPLRSLRSPPTPSDPPIALDRACASPPSSHLTPYPSPLDHDPAWDASCARPLVARSRRTHVRRPHPHDLCPGPLGDPAGRRC